MQKFLFVSKSLCKHTLLWHHPCCGVQCSPPAGGFLGPSSTSATSRLAYAGGDLPTVARCLYLPFGEHVTLLTLLTCVVTPGWSNETYSKGMKQKTALAIGWRSGHFNCNQNVIFISQICKTRSMACPTMCACGYNIEMCRQSFTAVTKAAKVFGEGSPAQTHKMVCFCTWHSKTGQSHRAA